MLKYTTRIATTKAQAIETFLYKNIPSWQTKLMLKYPFTRGLFGWRIEQHDNKLDDQGRFLTRVDLYRWKKPVDTLMITIKLKTI